MRWPRWGWLLVTVLAAGGLVQGLGNAAASGQAQVAAATVLYDGAAGGLPTTQGYFLYLTNPFFGAQASQVFADGATTLTTTAVTGEQAGYFGQNIPVLDPLDGYELTFRVRVLTETHNNGDRAGFSVILLGSDKLGIELGFWADTIWAQEGGTQDLFTHAEEVAYDTTVWTTYTLRVLENGYSLTAGGTAVLSGTVRDYSAFTGTPDVYETPNFIFMGDNSASAATVVQIAYTAVTQGPLLPLLDNSVFLPAIIKP